MHTRINTNIHQLQHPWLIRPSNSGINRHKAWTSLVLKKYIFDAGITIFNSLPQCDNMQELKGKYQVVLRKHLITHYFCFCTAHCNIIIQYKSITTTLTNQNSIQEEIKSRLKSWNACYHSVQNLSSSTLLSKNLKTDIYKTIILPVVCRGVKLGRSHWGRNVGWGCLRTGCWGEYLGLRGTR
jgi:hypothetical protein